jgi:3-phenylpropionate/trans-cinnamate dioxygenase ferredoxin reductase component
VAREAEECRAVLNLGVGSVRSVVVVGGNLAGGAVVSTLRDEGFDGRIALIGAEPHPPYERPPLSKEYLRGEADAGSTELRPQAWYAANDVELLLGRTVSSIHPPDRLVKVDGEESLPFDALVLATGGRNRRLSVPGADLECVFDLRTVEDADRIRAEAKPGRRAVVVGAGFIGCEVAASLRQMGVEVQVVEIFDTPLIRAVGPAVGRVLEAIHRDQGVGFHLAQVVDRFVGEGRVERVVTDRAVAIECDFVVVGVGIEPATELAQAAGAAVRGGIVVDELCRTSVDGVYAVGDVANHLHPVFGQHVRVEHWDNALKQGAAAARSIMGSEDPYDDLHWIWSDQFEHNLQYLGHAPVWDEFVVRGRLKERRFTGFYLQEGAVRAVVALNRGKDVRRSAGLIRSGRPVDPAQLRDEDVDLKKLSAALEAEP